MRIGIDIDGVLTDLARFVSDYGIKFCYDNNIEYKIKDDSYYESEALGISLENAEKFWNKYLPYYATEYGPREFAAEVIKKLKTNNEIYIITARNEEGLPKEVYGKMQSLVKEWLAKNQIEYDKLIFTVGSKLPYCLENGIDIMVEDSPRNLTDIGAKIPVLCFDNPYNRKIEGKNITRVHSWYDILHKIETFCT